MTEQRAHNSFRSSKAMEQIPVTPELAAFIVGQVRRCFPYRKIKPRIQFINKTGPFGRWGDADYQTQRIRLFKKGQNLDTLLHEIAHLLAPRTAGQHHNKDFYFACDLLERELFSAEVGEV